MTDIKIAVQGNRAILLRPVDLIAGTVGMNCVFYFDENWKNYTSKTISYKVGSTVLGSYEIKDNKATIPAKVLMTAELPLEVGITGKAEGGIIVPTSWCRIGNIQPGSVISGSISSDDIIYDGGSAGSDEIVYEGGGVGGGDSSNENIYEGGGVS